MKKTVLYAILLCCAQLSLAQVGIRTANPTATLHVVADSTYSHIFTLNDGVTSQDSYVLVASDENGSIKKESTNIFKNLKFANLATTATNRQLVPNTNPPTAFTESYVGDWYMITGVTIDLPYGKWAVHISSLFTLNEVNLESIMNTAVSADITMVDYAIPNPIVPSVDIEGDAKDSTNGQGMASGTIVFPGRKEIVKGIIIINNNHPRKSNRSYRFAARNRLNTQDRASFELLRSKPVEGLLHSNNTQTQVYAIPLN